MGDSVVSKRVYRSYHILLSNRVTLIYFIELDMLDFDGILGMDWLYACFALINCRTSVVKFKFPDEPFLKRKGETHSLEVKLFHV